jgi:DNA-binding transcriptional LysR family regulator
MQQFANRILPEFDEAARRIRDLAGGVQGRIEVAAQQSITSCGALPALLSEFQHAYPDVDVVLREESAGAAATLLRERRIDVALAQRADGNDADDLEIHDLYDEELVLGVAVDHPLLARARSWSDLADTVFIAFNESAALRTTLVTTCRSAGFEPRIGYESTALGSVRALASSGLGVALLPEPALAVAGPPVAVLRLGKTLRRTISILRVTSRYHSAASHAFTRLARERLAALVPTPVR